ncbi:MAG: hypothetical protein HPY55_00065 [Firmicutes bacterium]|nr:hypothetical protein [Bacillota bacterium]
MAQDAGSITDKTAGKHLIIGGVGFVARSGGTLREVRILKNGGATIGIVKVCSSFSSSRAFDVQVSAIENRSVNDYVELVVLQDTGSALDTVGEPNSFFVPAAPAGFQRRRATE